VKLTELLLDELENEARLSRRALEQVPQGQHGWKPHEKSMIFGYLADMVANVNPPAGPQMKREPLNTSSEFLNALDKSMAGAREALEKTTDEHLMTPWRLLAAGKVVSEASRYRTIRDTINHWVHHRGQMTVYLRLMGAKVPALYGPSADDSRFD
jgi:uncharacterized damage-inducible protein DinB